MESSPFLLFVLRELEHPFYFLNLPPLVFDLPTHVKLRFKLVKSAIERLDDRHTRWKF